MDQNLKNTWENYTCNIKEWYDQNTIPGMPPDLDKDILFSFFFKIWKTGYKCGMILMKVNNKGVI